MTNNRLKNLFNNDPHCYWCGRLTRFLNRNIEGIIIPLDTATLDHLYPRTHINHNSKNQRTVLACFECNRDRNDITQAIIRPPKGIRKNSKLYRKRTYHQDPLRRTLHIGVIKVLRLKDE